MAITYQELIDRAISIASRGVDPSTSPALAAEMVTEDLVATVFAQVSQTVAGDPSRRSMLRRTKSVSFTNGSGTVAEDVLSQYLSESTLYNTASLGTIYSWIPQWESFIRSADNRLGYYSVNESTIAVIEPGASYSATTGLTGTRSLVIPCTIAIPATASAAVVVRDELVDDLIMGLADALMNPIYKLVQPYAPRVRIQ